jgi:hypothetical protein
VNRLGGARAAFFLIYLGYRLEKGRVLWVWRRRRWVDCRLYEYVCTLRVFESVYYSFCNEYFFYFVSIFIFDFVD